MRDSGQDLRNRILRRFEGSQPRHELADWRLLAAAALGGLVTFVAHPALVRVTRLVRVLDAAGLGAFTVAGSLTALSAGAAPLTAGIVGTLTAIGGGMLRDVLAGEVPEVLQRELYAVPAVLGASAVVVAARTGTLSTEVALAAAVLVMLVRVVAVALDLNAPRALRTADERQRDGGRDGGLGTS